MRYLTELAGNPIEQEQQRFSELCQGWAIGSLGWRRALAREHRHLALASGFEHDALFEIKQTCWHDELKRGLAELHKIPVDLERDGPAVAWKIELARRLRLNVSAPCRWISATLHMSSPAAVRMHLYRHLKRVTA